MVKKKTKNIPKKRSRKTPKKIILPTITCYTDGSYSNSDDVGGYCAYLECEGKSLTISGHEHQTTNNRMELRAVLEALRIVLTPCKFIIHSDSRYVVDAINHHWINTWIKNKWITSTGKKVANIDLWKQIYNLLSFHTVEMVWVKGHSGVEGNELCDEISSMHMKTLKQYV